MPLFIEAARIFAIDSLQSGELAKIREKAIKMQHERILTERIGRLRGETTTSMRPFSAEKMTERTSSSVVADSTSSPIIVDAQLIRSAWQMLKHDRG